jgi:murein DD-endopeptidase MepM/ murein hydrolase activator NlpD
VGRDPEKPIRVDLRAVRDSLLAGGRTVARPIAGAIAELLAAGAGPSVLEPSAFEARLPFGLGSIGRHRRIAGFSACMLIVAVSIVGAMPAISAAGEPATVIEVATPAAEVNGVDFAPIPVSGDESVDAGDGSIYNVMQAVPVASPGAASGGFQVYAVHGGDTLAKIGARFGLSRLTIYWANTSRLHDPATLRVGQKLIIPPADGVTVTIKASDTISSYASKYRVSTKAIMTANGLTSPSVGIGQLLLIPVSPPPLPVSRSAGGGSTAYHGQRLRWPVPGSSDVSQYFSRSHPAIDIAAPVGTPVIAAIGGTVIWSGWKYSGGGIGGGIEIWINSGGKLYTTYNHLSRTYVKVGQVVGTGQHIGNVGMTGNATGPHLHFEVWVCYPWSTGGTSCARNPYNYF